VLGAALTSIPSLAETKKALQAEAMGETDALGEIDGRGYTNLKLLCQVGRACFNELGDPGRAALYQLTALHAASRKRAPAPRPSPAPSPAPA
jgi:hypothetical protein